MPDPLALALAVLSLAFFLLAVVVFVSLCVSAHRDDELMEAWRQERERADMALEERRVP